jgi:hypothetical protein
MYDNQVLKNKLYSLVQTLYLIVQIYIIVKHTITCFIAQHMDGIMRQYEYGYKL